MHPVSKGGIILDGGHVCGEWICATCSCAFGNEEGFFRCVSHTSDSKKENDAGSLTKVATQCSTKKRNKLVSKATKALEYSSKDILVLSQDFIQVSENAVEVAAKKSQKFWDEVADLFNKLKKQQESYDN
jgi:hypothetical protein